MDELPEHLRAGIERRLRERGVHGLAVCAFDTGGLRHAGGVGLADVDRHEPVRASTIFRVASVSKLVTAALVLELAEHGVLDLDRPVNEYLPAELHLTDRSGRPASPPLHSLLSHSSGLPCGIRGAQLPNPIASRLANRGRVDDLTAAVTGLSLTHAPDEKVVYSNPAFNLAGFAAAQVTGRPFEVLARERVLEPLGMGRSEFLPDRSGDGVAVHYGRVLPPAVGPRPAGGPRLVATPMGGLTSNVVELARFGRMVLGSGTLDGEQLLQPETVEAATTLRARNHPRLEQGYGWGFRVRSWRGRRVVGHDGNMPGVASQMVLAPEDGVGVVVLTNGFSLGLAHEVAALTLSDLLGLPAEEPVPPAPDAQDLGAWRDLAARVAGTYRLVDASPAGIIGRIDGAMTRVRVSPGMDGRLRLEGNPGSDGPAVLHPDGGVGHYRVAAAVDHGTDAVVEERADGVHLWVGPITHLHRPRRGLNILR